MKCTELETEEKVRKEMIGKRDKLMVSALSMLINASSREHSPTCCRACMFIAVIVFFLMIILSS